MSEIILDRSPYEMAVRVAETIVAQSGTDDTNLGRLV
jgi:hypothetical protein